MTQSNPKPTFNLWSEAWLTLERSSGPPVQASIEQALLDAHRYTAIYSLSPLAVAGIHRLLVAILQASLNPKTKPDLRSLWRSGQFPAGQIKEFGEKYSARFDLFSEDKPFMQSGDLPLAPVKGDNSKTVAYLAAETSPATAIDHYRHGFLEGEYFCPACLAGALLTIPPFISIGGRGYRPSINGIPPLYVLPVGHNLFESLSLSLLLPSENYWPRAAAERDLVWWKHPTVVERGKEVIEVGYLHSLTFPARQVRLHPVKLGSACTRCGQFSTWGARTMLFEMGESRPKDSAFWSDPFVAYRLPDEGRTGSPWAVRPDKGKALWREYAGLFLSPSEQGKKRVHRPAILSRIAEEYENSLAELNFRCIGARMDQAKVLEWTDSSFEVPVSLMSDADIAYLVRDATQFADGCAEVIAGVFRSSANTSRLGDRHKVLKEQMLHRYWKDLAISFRDFILSLTEKENRSQVRDQWSVTVTQQAQTAFEKAITLVGEDAVSLRQQEEGKQNCRLRLAKKQKKYLEEGVVV
ncbi:MAG: type I-E CRISPR-associated protein Cse1/CasA [Chloroflexi bacterium]|nr:type I-E CRISPR-associated protein Cse1/CasA [Chloroflexota bacterium]